MPERIITPVKQIAATCLTAGVQVGDTDIRGISPRPMYVYVPSNARSTVTVMSSTRMQPWFRAAGPGWSERRLGGHSDSVMG